MASPPPPFPTCLPLDSGRSSRLSRPIHIGMRVPQVLWLLLTPALTGILLVAWVLPPVSQVPIPAPNNSLEPTRMAGLACAIEAS